MQHWNHHTLNLFEEFKMLLLNRGDRVLGLVDIATGGMSSCVVDPKIVFAVALKGRASGIILAHNHPSG